MENQYEPQSWDDNFKCSLILNEKRRLEEENHPEKAKEQKNKRKIWAFQRFRQETWVNSQGPTVQCSFKAKVGYTWNRSNFPPGNKHILII